MAAWRKPDEDLVRRLDETVAAIEFDLPVDYRPMFGCPAYFTGGNLFAGVWQETLMLRLSEDDRAAVTAAGGGPFEPMPGRPMKEYVALPPSMVRRPGRGGCVGAQGGGVRRVAAAQEEEAAQEEGVGAACGRAYASCSSGRALSAAAAADRASGWAAPA